MFEIFFVVIIFVFCRRILPRLSGLMHLPTIQNPVLVFYRVGYNIQ